MSIPITLRAVRKRLSNLKPPEQPLEPESASSSSTPAHCAGENSPAVLPSSVLSPEANEEDELPSNPGHYVMSVAAAPAADSTNTDTLANRSPCASVGVYSHWVASSFLA